MFDYLLSEHFESAGAVEFLGLMFNIRGGRIGGMVNSSKQATINIGPNGKIGLDRSRLFLSLFIF